MSQTATEYPPPGGLGVMDAVRMGWALVMKDFWPIFLVGLVAVAIQMACGMAGSVPYIGGCIALAVGIFVQAPLNAGLFYAVRQIIDGAPPQVNDVFEGFRQRYWESVVAILPILVLTIGALVLLGGLALGVLAVTGVMGGHASDEQVLVAVLICVAVGLPVLLALMVVGLLFMFSFLAVWDYPGSGWEAVKASVRVAKDHLLSLFGLALLFLVIGLGAYLAGLIACCVGIFFTIPVLFLWCNATLIYLYRAWTGQALVQPLAASAPPYGQGALPPTSIEPPLR